MSFWSWLFPKSKWTHPDSVKCPARYLAAMRDAFWFAAAHLEGQGVFGHEHKIKSISVINGTVRRPIGWAVPAKFSPTGYAGGWTSSVTITWVCDPNTGAVPVATMRHEWGEALLAFAGPLTQEQRHALLGRAGL